MPVFNLYNNDKYIYILSYLFVINMNKTYNNVILITGWYKYSIYFITSISLYNIRIVIKQMDIYIFKYIQIFKLRIKFLGYNMIWCLKSKNRFT